MSLGFSFFILSIIALWVFIGSKGNWLTKALLISSILYFFGSVNSSMDSFSGWPTNDSLPEKFQVYWFVIDEPNLANNNPGKIYIWIIDIGEKKEYSNYGCNGLFLSFEEDHYGKPRVYKIKYSTKMHKRLQDILPSLLRGATVLGGKRQSKDDDTGAISELNDSDVSDEFMLYDLPEVLIQSK